MDNSLLEKFNRVPTVYLRHMAQPATLTAEDYLAATTAFGDTDYLKNQWLAIPEYQARSVGTDEPQLLF